LPSTIIVCSAAPAGSASGVHCLGEGSILDNDAQHLCIANAPCHCRVSGDDPKKSMAPQEHSWSGSCFLCGRLDGMPPRCWHAHPSISWQSALKLLCMGTQVLTSVHQSSQAL
jgi:hypothetical protein